MSMPAMYRRVNPQWIADFYMAHNGSPLGYFSANYVSPSQYITGTE